jgi:hypothetical protein
MAAAAAVATAGALAGPATASAQGVDPTRFCVQAAANTYLYNPYSVKTVRQFVLETAACAQQFANYMYDDEPRYMWRACLMNGLAAPNQPAPFISALDRCTARWLEFQMQIDPSPE